MVRVLVVEDEANIREMIALNLRLTGMEAVEAESAEAALPLLAKKPGCDAAILDVMLPGMNGFSLCETIRRTDQKIGIIILSAKGQEQDKIRGLSIGADDYITKPFNILEVKARIKAIFRRMEPKKGTTENTGILESGDMKLDRDGKRAYIQGREIGLTAKEFEVLELLMLNPDKVYSRENLLKLVWGTDYPGDVRTVDVHIRTLRQKLGSAGDLIETVRGVGYKIGR